MNEYSGTVFLLAYTCWVLLSRITHICTWKKLDLVFLFSAKLQESVQKAALKKSFSYLCERS